MNDMRDAGGLGREQFIIGLADVLKDCMDIHDPYERAIVMLNAIEKHQGEAYRRAVMRKHIMPAERAMMNVGMDPSDPRN